MNKSFLTISLAALCLSALFVSCAKNITCDNGVIAIYPVGFIQTDFDSALVIRYKQDNAFDSIADSTHMVSYSSADQDTGSLTVLSTNGTHRAFLIPGYDYKIFLPTAGMTFAITRIAQEGNKTQSYSSGLFGGGPVVSCTNGIVSCSLNGNPLASGNLLAMEVIIVK